MVNEHYVPQAYLRLFAPEDEGLVSRYSLVETHGGGDYVPPKDRYSVRKAASSEGFADGLLEGDETNNAERVMIDSLRKITNAESLTERDVAHISQFIAFQHSRTAESKLHFEARQQIENGPSEGFDDYWESVLSHNSDRGHESLQYMGWRVVENESDVPFITSDQPVVHYFEEERKEIGSTTFEFGGRQIFCPVGPDHLLLLLDPSQFRVDGQFPDTEIQRVTVSDRQEVYKLNLLQGISAFQEVFGPVDQGNLLESLINDLCDAFPHEDFVRGNHNDLETIQKAQHFACGGIETQSDIEWYSEVGRPLILSRRRESQAIWSFSHNLSLVNNLRRDDPDTGYWETY